MSKLLILGATGGTGRHVLAQALDKGYDVTVLTRHPDSLPIGVVGARVLTGDVLDEVALAGAIRGQDVVISTLGVGKSLKPGGLIAASAPAIVRTMEQAGVKRLIFTSGYGVGDTYQDVPLVTRIMIAVLLRNIYADKKAGEDVIRASHLDWTLVYPSTLADKPKSGKYRVGEHLELSGLPTIPREDVADFLVRQVEDRTYVRRGVLIST